MAEATKTIELIFAAVDQTSSVLGSMSSGIDTFAGKVENITAPAASLTKGLLAIEAAAAGVAVALGTFAVVEAGKFNASIREITTLVNGNEETVTSLSKEVRALAGNSAFAFDVYTGAVYNAVSATGDLGKGLAVTQQAEKLAVAGRAELNDTTLLLVSTLNAYGLGMDQAGRFSDVFFAAVQGGQTTVSELANTLGRVAPTAAAAGVSIEEVSAAVAFLTKSGVGTDQAVTGLRAALSNIIQPSEKAKKLAQELGIEFNTSALSSKGLAGFIEELATRTGGSVPKMAQLFGSVEALNAVLVLAQGGGSGFSDMLAQIQSSTGNTQQAYELMANSIPVQTQKLVNAIKGAAIAIGEPLLAPVAQVEGAIARVFRAIEQAADRGAFDPLITFIQEGLGNIEQIISRIAEILPQALSQVDYSRFIDSLRELGAALGLVFDDVDLTTPEGLASALQSLVNIGTTLVNVTVGIAEVVGPVIRQFFDWATSAGQMDKSTAQLAGNVLGLLTVINTLLPIVRTAAGVFDTLAVVLGAGRLLKAINEVGAAAPRLIAMLGPAGLTVAAGAAGFAVGTLMDRYLGASDAQDKWGAQIARWLHGPAPELLAQTEKFTTATFAQQRAQEIATREAQKASDQARESRETYAAWAKIADELGLSLTKTADGLFELTQSSAAVEQQVSKTTTAFEPLLSVIDGTGERSQRAAALAEAGFTDVAGVLTSSLSTFERYSHATDDAAKSLDELARSTELTIKEQADLALKINEADLAWAKLAQEERELVFRLEADIAIAQIEAGTEMMKAAFESVTGSIQSTGDALTELASIYANVQSQAKGSEILRLLEEENKRRNQAFEMQQKLVDSQVEYLQAVTERLNQGEATIQIDTSGLEPALETVLFEILKKVQLRASSEAQLFLLGLQ